MPDEEILNRRTWIVVGVIFGLLAVVVMAGVIMQPVIRTPRVYVDSLPHPAQIEYKVGDAVRVRETILAAAAAGPAAVHGARCTFDAGVTGAIVELGQSLTDPAQYVEVKTLRCAGWVPATAIERR